MSVKMLVTPEQAQEWLEHNYERQRGIRKTVVRQYARDMESGNWNEDVEQPIVITKDGTLIDGQHRLAALVETGRPLWMFVVTDADISQFDYIDCGARRKASDMLMGIPNRNMMASLGKMAYATVSGTAPLTSCLYGRICNRTQATRVEISTYVIENEKELQRFVRMGSNMRNEVKCGSGSVYAYALYISDFIGDWGSGEDLYEDFIRPVPTLNVVSILKRKLFQNADKAKDNKWLLGTVLQAINAVRTRTSPKQLNKGDTYVNIYSKLVDAERRKRAGEES